MTKVLFKCEEWQGGSGLWYCGHTASFPSNVDLWVVPARILGVSADKFIKMLIDNFHPDIVYHNEDCSFVGWAWKSQAAMRKYKVWINKIARERNYQI